MTYQDMSGPDVTTIPSQPVKFIFIRHGEAAHNVGAENEGDGAYKNPGFRNANLTAKGYEQVANAGRMISINVTTRAASIWSSPLQRCLQTATCVLESVNVPSNQMFVHDALLERLGDGQVCNERDSTSSIRSEWPKFNAVMLPDVGPEWDSREDLESVKLRMTMLVTYLKEVYAGATSPVIIVSHYEALFEILGHSLKNAEYVVTEWPSIGASVRELKMH